MPTSTDKEPVWTVSTAFEQLERCSFECEAGPLENSSAYRWLKTAYNPDERLPALTDAMLEAGATAFCETQTLDPRKMTKEVYAAMMKASLREALEPCGTNPSLIPADIVGCGEPFASFADAYRCAHCDVLFHKACAEKHFRNDDVLTEEMVVEIERRSALSPLPQERKICTYCDGHGIYEGKDVVSGAGVELACQYCNETGFEPTAKGDPDNG